jgi:N-acetylglucosaminyldiphosphoundecaprenol N-acetyl-beta-D-mannosaminyltransferase
MDDNKELDEVFPGGSETDAVPERIYLMGVPLDIIPPETLERCIYDIFDETGAAYGNTAMRARTSPGLPDRAKNIVLLSLWDFLRARRQSEYADYVKNACLVIPISRSLISGSRFLTGKTPYRYMPFDFVISLLSILERREFTVYLMGGTLKVLKLAEKNIVQTFPHLRIIGRHPGSYKRTSESSMLTSIHKSAPALLLVGRGVHGGEKWLARHTGTLGGSLHLWCSDLFDIFADKRSRPSRAVFNHGLEWFGYCLRRPWKFLRIFPYIGYKLTLLKHKLTKRNAANQ